MVGSILFQDILTSTSVIIPYGIHPFDICVKNPDLWQYIKIIFCISYIFSSLIISNSFYSIFFQFINYISKYIKNTIKYLCKFKNLSFIKKIYYLLINKLNMKKKYTFFDFNISKELIDYPNKKIINKINYNTKNILRIYVGTSANTKDTIYLLDKSLFQNVLITGTIGTGKTSSAMYPFTKQLIEFGNNDFNSKIGMLILDVKGNYHKKVLEFATNCNRNDDVIIIKLGGKYKYNPLHKPNLKPSVLANRLKTILLLFSPNNTESYWLDKVEQILAECIKLCRLYNNYYVTFEEIHKLISIPNYYLEKIDYLREKFINNYFSKQDIYNLISSLNFFQKEFFSLDIRTLSILRSEITRITNIFISDYEIYQTFNPTKEELNFYGFEDLINTGKIVVLDMNISEYRNLSKIIAAYLKLDFQTEVMTRLANNFETSNRIVAFISDEYHEYVTVSDSEFYAQSREAKCINIVATQSYTSLLNSLNNKYSVEVILQNLVNKFWFRTDDIYTIESIQKQIGKEYKEKFLKSISENAKITNYSYITESLNSTDSNISESISKQLYYEYKFDTKFFTQELQNFCSLAFLSDGNKIINPQKIYLKPYFKN